MYVCMYVCMYVRIPFKQMCIQAILATMTRIICSKYDAIFDRECRGMYFRIVSRKIHVWEMRKLSLCDPEWPSTRQVFTGRMALHHNSVITIEAHTCLSAATYIIRGRPIAG